MTDRQPPEHDDTTLPPETATAPDTDAPQEAPGRDRRSARWLIGGSIAGGLVLLGLTFGGGFVTGVNAGGGLSAGPDAGTPWQDGERPDLPGGERPGPGGQAPGDQAPNGEGDSSSSESSSGDATGS